MSIVYQHPDWLGGIYWEFDPSSGWDEYSNNLDDISSFAKDSIESFIIIFHPLGDIPKGNPIPHMRRIVQFSKNNPKVIKTIIIMGTDWILAKAFVNVLNKIMFLEPEVKLVFSVEEAHEVCETTMNSIKKT